ncbi:MAG: winged helix-turn-helix transcriptional regulator [Sporomusaceae bacterium]|nr:winged helix-turn-helix transcriptional regulator [Sporomusaceae bacterium]
MEIHEKYVPIFKALADETRLKIVEMLSCGEMCACDILESFQITQPTLSYHLKILTDSGIVKSRKEGSWIRFSNNEEVIQNCKEFWTQITTAQETCICYDTREIEVGRCD